LLTESAGELRKVTEENRLLGLIVKKLHKTQTDGISDNFLETEQ
jgi:hypothetical protein